MTRDEVRLIILDQATEDDIGPWEPLATLAPGVDETAEKAGLRALLQSEVRALAQEGLLEFFLDQWADSDPQPLPVEEALALLENQKYWEWGGPEGERHVRIFAGTNAALKLCNALHKSIRAAKANASIAAE